MNPLKVTFLSLVAAMSGVFGAEDTVRIAPAPEGEPLSKLFAVTVDGKPAPVYALKVAPENMKERTAAMDDKENSAKYFTEAAFTTFDLQGPVKVVVTYPEAVTKARILPASAKIEPEVSGSAVTIPVAGPSQLTLEVNGKRVETLHIFANAFETDVPKADDPNVVYFGPGIHEVDHLKAGSGKTIYIAAGAIVRGKPANNEKGGSIFSLEGDDITIRGRGIIDGSLCPTHWRHLIFARGKNLKFEGLILRDSSLWTVPIRQSDNVSISNMKLLGYRANSDGFDICNSRDVHISDCFIRTLDDLVVVKTDKGQGKTQRVLVEKCVLWNEFAHALSIGAELREDVEDVRFSDCDVLADLGREWTLRVFHCDAAWIRDVVFENIRVAQSERLISLWIDKTGWSRDEERGNISDVVFRNITCDEGAAKIEFKGFDAEHLINNVRLENIAIHGQPLKAGQVIKNEFAKEVAVTP